MTNSNTTSKSTEPFKTDNLDHAIRVVILGCGYSGMISAIALAKLGFDITIIESKSVDLDEFFDDPRTLAITSSSKKFFEEIGIWDNLKDFCAPINDIYVVDNKSPEMIHFETSDLTNDEFMGYMCLNSEFKRLLFDIVKKIETIKIFDKTTYNKIENSDSGCLIELSQNYESDDSSNEFYKKPHSWSIKSDIVIACDGKNSSAKKNFFSNYVDKDYHQKALTFIIHHEKPHEGTAVEHFLNSAPVAILPLRWPNKSSVVCTGSNHIAEAIGNLPASEFENYLQSELGDFLGKITVDKFNQNRNFGNKLVKDYFKPFSLTASISKRYVNKRIVLIADSAHTIHPLAGQGLNQGIKDIDAFQKLLSSLKIHKTKDQNDKLKKESVFPEGSIDSEGSLEEYAENISVILEEYENTRKADNYQMFEITDTINSLFSNRFQVLRKARNVGFHMIEKLPPFKRAVVKYAMGKRSK